MIEGDGRTWKEGAEHGTSWKNMEYHGRKEGKPMRNQWKAMEPHGKCWKESAQPHVELV